MQQLKQKYNTVLKDLFFFLQYFKNTQKLNKAKRL